MIAGLINGSEMQSAVYWEIWNQLKILKPQDSRRALLQRDLLKQRQAMPQIDLKSPKITRKLTTEWFARRVEGRYRSCLSRAESGV